LSRLLRQPAFGTLPTTQLIAIRISRSAESRRVDFGNTCAYPIIEMLFSSLACFLCRNFSPLFQPREEFIIAHTTDGGLPASFRESSRLATIGHLTSTIQLTSLRR
jgi:hypothetical protein